MGNTGSPDTGRRAFIGAGAALGACFLLGVDLRTLSPSDNKSTVFVASGTDRAAMLDNILRALGQQQWTAGLTGKRVVLKPNFNSAHAFPGSTHPEMLDILTSRISDAKPSDLLILDRSGMGDTEQVMQELGAAAVAATYGGSTLPWEKIDASDMIHTPIHGGHWNRGVEWPKQLVGADAIVQTCCLKTHQYGGHFTLSLKNSVGMVAKFAAADGYNYMRELHSSQHQRRMIAEINTLYRPHLVIMDAIKCFIDGGPHIGTVREPRLMLASTDRVALDAVGVALLRGYGTTPEVSEGRIFEQEQLARAAELGIGVSAAENISLNPVDTEAEKAVADIRAMLSSEG